MRIVVVKKKMIIWFIILLSIIIVGLLSIYRYNEVARAASLPTLRKVIIIDPGHGGVDGGMVGTTTGVCESQVNLEIALKLRKYLEESGSLVLMTRDEDMGLYTDGGTIRKKKNEDLRNRKRLFDESNADIVISIHSNSFQESKYYGAQSFYSPNSQNGKLVAELIQEELIRVLDNGNTRKAKSKNDVYILKNVKVPTVIVECGFLSNPKEEKLLQSSDYQEKIAWSIYVGILKYFHKLST